MRRLLWNAGLVLAYVVGLVALAATQEMILQAVWSARDRGPLPGMFLALAGLAMAIPVVRFWRGRASSASESGPREVA